MSKPLLTKTQLYTPEQVAKLLQVDVSTIYSYIRQKRLLATRLGRVYRIPAEAVEDLVVRNADWEAYESFLISRLQRVRERTRAFDQAQAEQDALEAATIARHGQTN